MSGCELDKKDCDALRRIINNFESNIIDMTINVDKWTTGEAKEKLNKILEKDEQILSKANIVMKKCSCDVQLMKAKERVRHEKLTGLRALIQKKQEEWENK